MTTSQTDPLVSLLEKLIRIHSISPNDAQCQEFLITYLERLGFSCQRYDNLPVSNFFARIGTESPLLMFAGHTDVVPPGDLSRWETDPFVLTKKAGFFYGRGTADMKGGLACMLDAVYHFLKENPKFNGSLGFLITSGEEGDDFMRGTPYVMEELKKQGITIDYCVVGEPSSSQKVGDEIKIGRRGSLSAAITLHGIQGHVAYPHLACNPIHTISPVLAELSQPNGIMVINIFSQQVYKSPKFKRVVKPTTLSRELYFCDLIFVFQRNKLQKNYKLLCSTVFIITTSILKLAGK